jgi:hypothetical protein
VEPIDPIWLFGGIALVAGALFGFVLNRLLNPAASDVEKLQAELEQARKDMESYKASVNSHFNKTSDLVNDLTQDYVKVYRHLAEGAQTLSDTREFTQVLDQPQGKILISVDTPADEAPEPLAAQAEQTQTPVAEDAPGAGSDANASVQTAAEDDAATAPVDYTRARATAATSEESVGPGSESIADKDDDKISAAESVDEVAAEEDDSASEAAAEQPAESAAAAAESAKKS